MEKEEAQKLKQEQAAKKNSSGRKEEVIRGEKKVHA